MGMLREIIQDMKFMDRFVNLLVEKLGVEVYSRPVDKVDCLVVLCRLQPMISSDRDLTMSEARCLRFIEDILKKTKNAGAFKLRLSRPWVLKKDQLAYTWDFTIQGDLDKALGMLESVEVMKVPGPRTEEVFVQQSRKTRGQVKPVSIGAIR